MLPEGQYARQARLASQSDLERDDAGRRGEPHFTFENTNKNTCSEDVPTLGTRWGHFGHVEKPSDTR
jgi:hypothetical protein